VYARQQRARFDRNHITCRCAPLNSDESILIEARFCFADVETLRVIADTFAAAVVWAQKQSSRNSSGRIGKNLFIKTASRKPFIHEAFQPVSL
jgi:hypothetical protein